MTGAQAASKKKGVVTKTTSPNKKPAIAKKTAKAKIVPRVVPDETKDTPKKAAKKSPVKQAVSNAKEAAKVKSTAVSKSPASSKLKESDRKEPAAAAKKSKATAKKQKVVEQQDEEDDDENDDDEDDIEDLDEHDLDAIKVLLPEDASDDEDENEDGDGLEEDAVTDAELIRGIESEDDGDSSDEEDHTVADKKKKPVKGGKKSISNQAEAEIDTIKQGSSVVLLSSEDNEKLVKATKGKKKDKGNQGPTEPGVIYLGRIPHGFYESEMKAYFSQFGDVTRLRLSRNPKTGRSRHFAFIEFKDSAVATIVAETMDNYLMFNHILRCKVVPKDKLHPETFKGAGHRFVAAKRAKLEARKHNRPKTPTEWADNVDRLIQVDRKKRKQLHDLGIDYDFPGYTGAIKKRIVNATKKYDASKGVSAKSAKKVSDSVTDAAVNADE
eukprot:jgi/Hompol1/2870/HPOL_006202-RA